MIKIKEIIDELRETLLLKINHEIRRTVDLIEAIDKPTVMVVSSTGIDKSLFSFINNMADEVADRFSVAVLKKGTTEASTSGLKASLLATPRANKKQPVPATKTTLHASHSVGQLRRGDSEFDDYPPKFLTKITDNRPVFTDSPIFKPRKLSERSHQQPLVMSASESRLNGTDKIQIVAKTYMEPETNPSSSLLTPHDKQFNAFLESELERIKRDFLHDDPATHRSRRNNNSIGENSAATTLLSRKKESFGEQGTEYNSKQNLNKESIQEENIKNLFYRSESGFHKIKKTQQLQEKERPVSSQNKILKSQNTERKSLQAQDTSLRPKNQPRNASPRQRQPATTREVKLF